MTTFTEALAASLRAERGALNLSIEDVAAQSGVPFGTLRRYMAGKRDIPMSAVVLIAHVYGMKPSQLMADAERRQEQDQT